MTQLSRYRPNYVRHFIEHNPQGLSDVMSIHWQHEIRQTLLLGERACCESVLCQPDALWLEESQHPANDQHPALTPWVQALNQAALTLGTLPELDSAQKLYSIGVMISYASKRVGTDAKDCADIAHLPEELAALPVLIMLPLRVILCAVPAVVTPIACDPAYTAENWVVLDL